MSDAIDAIHQYWFGTLDASGMSAPTQQALWFKSRPETDASCRQRFGHLVDDALAGGLQAWQASDRGLVALVLLLDQFTRNIYRGTANAFAGDPRALDLALQCAADGRDTQMPAIHRVFLLLPLEHSEDLAMQDACVARFEQLASATGLAQIADFTRYAEAHREVIARFGRFPHRNALLGRTSTAAELAHLEQHGGF